MAVHMAHFVTEAYLLPVNDAPIWYSSSNASLTADVWALRSILFWPVIRSYIAGYHVVGNQACRQLTKIGDHITCYKPYMFCMKRC